MNIAKEFAVLFIFCISSLCAKDNSIAKEKHLLDDSLKILRKDFNQLIGNVEDFVGDFVVQIEEASKVAASVYTDDDYNWQDSKLTTSKHETTTRHSFQSNDQTVPSTVDLISNEIESRKKRSSQDLHNFEDQKHSIERRVLMPTKPPPLAYQEFLGSQQESTDTTAEGKICKTATATNLEQQQFEELKQEVRKLSDLVQLLKDQQLLIKTMDERNLNSKNIDGNVAKNHFFPQGLEQFEKHKNEELYSVDDTKLKAIEKSLKTTEENLKTTNELLKTEIEKEKMLEKELKKQSSELKFIKVMMEHIYDSNNNKKKIDVNDSQKRLFDDVDSIVGATRMPNFYPLRSYPLYDIGANKGENRDSKFVKSLMPRQIFQIDVQNDTFSKPDVETTTIKPATVEEATEDIEKEIEESAFKKYLWKEENEILRDKTINALINITKYDPERFNMFNFKNRTDVPTTGNHFLRRSSGFIPSTRASAKSRKSDDLDLKLKLIDLLTTNEAKTIDNVSNNDRQTEEVLKSLLKPQKKSDDEVTLEVLKSLIDRNKQKQKNEDTLRRLMQSLNKPESKIEDSDIESELKQLQKVINQLKPKDDLGSFDIGNDGRQDFQSMLSQIISQNPAGSINSGPGIPPQPSLGTSNILGQNTLILPQNRPQIQSYSYLNALKPNLYYPYAADSKTYNGNSYNSYQYNPYQNTPVGYDYGYAPPPIYSPISSSYLPYSYLPSNPLNNYYPNSNAYSGKPPQEAASLDYSGNNFFQFSGPNPEYNYGSKSATQTNLGQSYAPSQTLTDDYKYGVISDLTRQIQNLESTIAGLRNGDYSQNYEDKTAIASLEQRIYDLKGVINSLNSPQPYAPSLSPPYQQSERTLYVTPPLPSPIEAAPQSSPPVYRPPQQPIPEPSRPNYAYQPSSVLAQPSSNPYQPPKPSDPRPPYQSKEVAKDGLRSATSKRLKRQIAGAASSGEDVGGSFNEIANVFKQYINEPKITSLRKVDERSSTLDNLQQTLDNLKLQLGSEKSSERSLSNLINPASSAYYVNSLYDSHQTYIPHSNTNDMFSEVIVKIVEKIFASLPEALKRVSGNLLSDIGNSYGDYNSPLQNVLRNLGSFGQIPLVLIKILESVGDIIKYLKKNKFFREFLLPGLILGLIGGAILFLIYFLQSDEEPYGYISYHSDNYQDFPKYQPNHYVSGPPNSNTGYDNYYVKKYKSANDYSSDYNNDRSSHIMPVNDFKRNMPLFGFSRGYYENV
ncbi:uncharacterized protein [Euwallacea fornicatus]|uniref:uncharacterized protein isoform X3 n=1 Tax=Euwallacea fornicatus TaxID=995702 RepID=UPI00338DF1F2